MSTLNAPWTLDFDRDGTEDIAIIRDAAGETLATSRPFWISEEGDPASPTLEAMRVMAAAPGLLAALQDLLDQLEAIGIADWHGAEGLFLDAAKAAIAEATGKGNANHYAIYQLADDEATYGSDAGKFIVTTRDHEDEVAGPMSEKDARSLAAALNACRMVRDRWECGDLAEAAKACTTVVATASGRAA